MKLIFKLLWYCIKIIWFALKLKWQARNIKAPEPIKAPATVADKPEYNHYNMQVFQTMNDGGLILGKCHVPIIIYEEFIHNAMENMSMKIRLENGVHFIWNTEYEGWFKLEAYDND